MSNLQSLVHTSYEMLLAYAEKTPITFLHPQSRYRLLTVARLLSDTPRPVLYYALGPYDVNVNAFLSNFLHDIASHYPQFGRHLNQLAFEVREYAPEELLPRLLADLAEVIDEPYFLVLDAYDACEKADDVQAFLEQILVNLPDHCHAIINSRNVPRLPWYCWMARDQAVMLLDQTVIQNPPYPAPVTAQTATHIEVQAFGPGSVIKDGEEITDWEGHLPRMLLVYALERPLATRSEICLALWPDLESDQAVNVFHVTKRRLHKALDMEVLVHDEGYYQMNPLVNVSYDVSAFVTAILNGRVEGENAPEHWQKALELYRGAFMQGHGDGWVEEHRIAYQGAYLEAMMALAHHRLAAGRPEHALRMLMQAATDSDGTEALHREIMKLYATMGRRSEAASYYQALVENLRARNSQPEPATRELYHHLMN